jgi:hypothetical protein
MGSSRNLLHRFALLFMAVLLAAVVGGCASTRITSEWKDESLSRLPRGSKAMSLPRPGSSPCAEAAKVISKEIRESRDART